MVGRAEDLILGSPTAAPTRIPAKLAKRFEPYLVAGERLAWAAKPPRPIGLGDFQQSGGLLALIMGLGAAVLAAYVQHWDWAAALAIAALLVAMVAVWINPPVSNVGRQLYALTDRRALILQQPPEVSALDVEMRRGLGNPLVEVIVSIDLAELQAVTAERRPRRLQFMPEPNDAAFAKGGLETPSAFVGLPKQDQVLQLIERLRADLLSRVAI